ncbi:MAG: nucleotidyltransferase family protein [Clostridia bacterium]|nr:nucleotidyltransferase family protein [Clostridia bacterium]
MITAGIICEFNPFHKGHKYLIDSVRAQTNADAIVCVMSGDFVQRGIPAMWDKYERAKMAVLGGADLVIELPSAYALSAAPDFARGGISVLKKLGCVSYLGFGSECGDIEALLKASEAEEDDGFSDRLKANLEKGMTYPKAYAKASGSALFDTPNNILGIEYLRENKRQNAGLKPVTVKRLPGVSAEAIRADFGPNSKDYSVPNWNAAADERLFALIKYKLLNSDAKQLQKLPEVSEGIENKLKKEIIKAKSLDDLIKRTKSKRFTYAKISRILLQLLLDIKKSDLKTVKSVKILAFSETGKKVLKEAKRANKLTFEANEKDAHGADIYSILIGRDIYSGSDYVINTKPIK